MNNILKVIFLIFITLFSCKENKTPKNKKASVEKMDSIGVYRIPKKQRKLKFSESFNKGNLNKSWRKEITKNNSYKIDTISKQGRLSDGYLITTTNKTGVNGKPKRSEYGIKLYDSINQKKFLSFSFKIPTSLSFDDKNLKREIMICQWHSKPAPGKTWNHYKKYNKYNRPSVALYITTSNNKDYWLILRYGNNGKPKFDKKDEIWSVIALQKIKKNKWYDLVFEIKWHYTNAGYIASWINNKPFTPFNGMHNKIYGANMHNASPTYFKFGQYRYWDDTNTQSVYFDEFKVGDSFKEVSLHKPHNKNILPGFIKNHK